MGQNPPAVGSLQSGPPPPQPPLCISHPPPLPIGDSRRTRTLGVRGGPPAGGFRALLIRSFLSVSGRSRVELRPRRVKTLWEKIPPAVEYLGGLSDVANAVRPCIIHTVSRWAYVWLGVQSPARSPHRPSPGRGSRMRQAAVPTRRMRAIA